MKLTHAALAALASLLAPISQGQTTKPDALLQIDLNRAAVVERIVEGWKGEIPAAQLASFRNKLNALRADQLLVANLSGSFDGVLEVLSASASGSGSGSGSRLRSAQSAQVSDTAKAVGELNQDLVYTPVTPCRVFDTRTPNTPFVSNGLNSGVMQTFDMDGTNLSAQGGSATGCNIPTAARAVVLAFSPITPPTTGWVIGAANDGTALPASTLFNYSAALTLTTFTVVMPMLGQTGGDIRLEARGVAAYSMHGVGDVTGYFMAANRGGVGLRVVNTDRPFAIYTDAPNVVNGAANNFVASEIAQGATISGGGYLGSNCYSPASSNGRTCGNIVEGTFGTIGGGAANLSVGINSTISGGFGNTANGPSSSIAGGIGNFASDYYSAIGGGQVNSSKARHTTIAGGYGNQAGGEASTISGGATNETTREFSVVSGGRDNVAGAALSTVSGGSSNSVLAAYSSISGGVSNLVEGEYSAVGGGLGNTAGGYANAIFGGVGNRSGAALSTVSGGYNNQSFGRYSIVSGGAFNRATGSHSIAVSGESNLAIGNFSFAAGRGARTGMDVGSPSSAFHGSFVWSDSNENGFYTQSFTSTANDQFAVRSRGGVAFRVVGTDNADTGAGCALPAGGAASWSCSSDRNLKESIQSISPQSVLSKVLALPVTSWQFIGTNRRHIGPMAQDFRSAFGLGADDKNITTSDVSGVALAAIQGLNQKLEAEKAKVQKLERELAAIKKKLGL
jgi:trimeric autotransporter adhesin